MSSKKNEKYQRIINAGVDVFTEKGFYQATVEEIAQKAGVGKGTVYTYFENKDGLLNSILDQGIERLSRYVREKILAEAPPPEKLKTAVYSIIEYFSLHQDFCIFLARKHFGYNRLLKEQAEKIHDQQGIVIRNILQEGKEKGVFQIEDVYTLSSSIIGAIFGASFYWFIFSNEFPVDKIYRSVEDLFFRNILG